MTTLGGLLSFAARSRVRSGFGWLLDDGTVDRGRGIETWISARMTHVFCLALLMGREDLRPLAEHGVSSFGGPLRDREHGGWFRGSGSDTDKAAYEHAFVVLAGSSASLAGLGNDLLLEALDIWDTRFWDEQSGTARELWDRRWTRCDDYRGANANMHGVEAMLAAAEALPSRRDELLARCVRVLERIVHIEARGRQWRLPEHFDADWNALLDYNAVTPADPFRPFGVTPGHQFEWARLAVHTAVALGDPAPPWLVKDAVALYDAARSRAWAPTGGLVYTLDWRDRPVVSQQFHWVLAEAIAAAAVLGRVTRDGAFTSDLRTWTAFAEERFADPRTGSWRHELDPDGTPATSTWTGQPDAYHVVQALLLAELPVTGSVARSLLSLRGAPAVS
ncbi:MAG: N-acylglucosamine 2-epimerase [Frankiales bacterium]|nr:N-acylglucosamine 2-epimerase [Frankiales bacterium]